MQANTSTSSHTTQEGGTYLKYVLYVVFAAALIYILYLIIMAIKRKLAGQSIISTYPDAAFKLPNTGSQSGQSRYTYEIKDAKFHGNLYTFSTKMRIYDNFYSTNAQGSRSMVMITDTDVDDVAKTQTHRQNPGLYLDSVRNNLEIIITTNNGGTLVPEKISIDNIPVRKTFTLTITVKDRQVTVYLDEKMVRAQVLSYMPLTLAIGTKLLGGLHVFNGEYANPRVWDVILTPDEIKQVVRETAEFKNEYLASTVNSGLNCQTGCAATTGSSR